MNSCSWGDGSFPKMVSESSKDGACTSRILPSSLSMPEDLSRGPLGAVHSASSIPLIFNVDGLQSCVIESGAQPVQTQDAGIRKVSRPGVAIAAVSRIPNVIDAVAEICDSTLRKCDICPNLAIVFASVQYSNEMKRLGTNIKQLLEQNGLPRYTVVHGAAVLGIGAIVDGIVHTAQRCLPEVDGQPPHSDMMAILFVEMHGLQTCGFYVPSNREHDKKKSRNKTEDNRDSFRQRDDPRVSKQLKDRGRNSETRNTFETKNGSIGDSFCFEWNFPKPVPESICTSPDALFLSSRTMRIDGLYEQYPRTSISGALLPNIVGIDSGTFVERLTFHSMCGLAVKCLKNSRIIQESFGQSESGPEMLERMREFYGEIRRQCASPVGGETEIGRPVFAWIIGCFGRYPGAVLSQYTAQGCDFERVRKCFGRLPTIGVFSFGELLPDSPKNQQFSCVVSVFCEFETLQGSSWS
jgi:hypothetical protein